MMEYNNALLQITWVFVIVLSFFCILLLKYAERGQAGSYRHYTDQYETKLLLHWLRKVRNSCAHNERVYCIKQLPARNDKNSGRILEGYFRSLRPTYLKDKDKKIIDLLVYFKYYLTDKDFKDMMGEFQKTLLKLQSEVSTNAFDNVRGKMGIKNLADLETLKNLPKTKIMHHKFETY